MEVEFVKFKASKATRDDWEKLHRFRRIRHEEVNPDDPIFPDDIVEQGIIQIEQSLEFEDHQIVVTGNATTNAPILSINERLGFIKHKESVTGQITTEQLGQYLSSRKEKIEVSGL